MPSVSKLRINGVEYDLSGGGGGGTSNYNDLTNKPQINGNELSGNKTAAQLGLASSSDIPDVSTKYDTNDNASTDIVDSDYVPFYDTSATARKKTLWSNIKEKLKTYFDNIYASISHTHGNIQNGGTLQTTDVTIANGDKLVITDASDSNKVARTSTSFDGSTTSTALTPKGTFEAFYNARNVLQFNSNNLPQFSGAPEFLLGIESFANGGATKWSYARDVLVGKANQLNTARNINLGSDFAGSASFNGSSDVTINSSFYNVGCNSGNTANYPWHRIAKVEGQTGQWVDKEALLLIRASFNGGALGLIKIALRTNATGNACTVSAKWLYRYGLNENDIVIAHWGTTGQSVYADVFLKRLSYARTVVYQVVGSRSFTLVTSSEANDTTTSDKKTSVEVYKSVAIAATEIHNQAYTSTVEAEDGGNVAYAKTAGSATDSTKVAKSGDTMTGNLGIVKAGEAYVQAKNSTTQASVFLDASSGPDHGVWSNGYYDGSTFHSDGKWIIRRGADGNVYVNEQNLNNPIFSQASSRVNIASGEKLSVILGKIMKWFADLKAVAFSGKTSDLTNNSNFVSDASYVHTDNNYTTTEKNKLAGIAESADAVSWTQHLTGGNLSGTLTINGTQYPIYYEKYTAESPWTEYEMTWAAPISDRYSGTFTFVATNANIHASSTVEIFSDAPNALYDTLLIEEGKITVVYNKSEISSTNIVKARVS